jgi:CRP-like cAMP-binding protein
MAATQPERSGHGRNMSFIGPDIENRLLDGLDDLQKLAPGLRSVTLTRGDVLQDQWAPIETVYFPLGGLISLEAVMTSGATAQLAMVGREGAIGLTVGGLQSLAFARAVVQVPNLALCLPVTRFRDAAVHREAVLQLTHRYQEALLAQVSRIAVCNLLHPIAARFARWLLQAADRVDTSTATLTHEMISQALGARRPTITQLAGALQEHGLIKYSHGHITVADRAGLEARACECYGIIRRCTEAVFQKPVDHP